MKAGKRRKDSISSVDREKLYSLQEACGLLKRLAFAKFDETVDFAARLGVNPRHADQMVRGAVALPHGTGKQVRVLVFAKGDKANEASEAGADHVGADDIVEKINGGWIDFDVVIASPDMMGQVGRLGRVLGPRGLMPNPKVGTVTLDVGKAVRDAKAGKIEFRVERAGIVHVPVGKCSFEEDNIANNVRAVVNALVKAKPSTAKGTYIKSLSISSTMGPGIRLNPASIDVDN